MNDAKAPDEQSRLLKVGLISTVIAALCCFTPVLVILFGAVGLSAMLGWLDYVLLPALTIFIGITVYALWKRRNSGRPS
ncbi:mercury resistance system transport protein MerF [Antarcticimicrobium sediminis]|uniref:mercury resistance system transport protein MerF n=1 Tax=Antarcticimicrobium sediminis TaxID=2546227 RepID=UPI001FDFB231|nr:mercury resistance system transport protein MerF [Antarcticimicrobium sediminis]